MLQGLGMLSLGALLGPSLISPGTAAAAGPTGGAVRGAQVKGRVGATGYSPLMPLQVQASSQLSEDHFLTSELTLGPDDKVLPFVNPYNHDVEAMVFSGGALNHLYRDPGQSTGWAYMALNLDNLFTDVTDVAIAANDSTLCMMVFGTANNSGDYPAWVTKLNGATVWDTGRPCSYDDLKIPGDASTGALKGGISPDGSTCYFYTAVTSGSTTKIVGWVASGNFDVVALNYQQFKTIATPSSGATLVDYLVLFNQNGTTGKDPKWYGYALTYTSDGLLSVYDQVAGIGDTTTEFQDLFSVSPNVDLGADGVTALLWAWTADGSTTGYPGYAFQTSSGIGFSDLNGNYNTLAAHNSLTANQATVWLQDDLYTVNFLDSDGTVNTVQEISGADTGSWGMPVPVSTQDKGFVAIYGVPTDPSESTLFAVGADETLSALTLGSTGWTQSRIQQGGGATLASTDSYRVLVSVHDANGAAVPLAKVQVGTDRLVGFWQPEGSTIIIPSNPVTLTTDVRGQLTFSVPAEELDTAEFTVQALDSKNSPSGSVLQVIGDYDVRAYLQGTGTLTHLGQLSGEAMANARDSSGNSVFPVLNSDPDVAGQCVTALGQLITAGAAPTTPPSAGTAPSALIDTSTTTPSYQTGSSPTTYPAPLGKPIGSEFKHLFDSIGHALRHYAAKLKQTVIRWAEDVGHWVVDMAIEIGGAVYSFANQVISDMKDAFHVIGGFFHALGADIKAAIDWLKHNVTELLHATSANATIIENWLKAAPAQFTTVIDKIEIDSNAFFSTKQQAFDSAVGEVATAVEDATFGSSAPLPPPKTNTGSSSAESDLSKAIGDIGKVLNDLSGNWLLDKIMKCLGGETAGNALIAAFQQPIDDLATDFKDLLDVGGEFGTLLGQTAKTFATKDGFTAQGMSAWFADVQQLGDGVLTLADAIVDTVLDLVKAVLDNLLTVLTSYTIDFDDLLGPLLAAILELAKIDLKMTTGHLVSLIIAFPSSLIAQIRGLQSLFPSQTETAEQVGDSQPSWLTGLGIAAAVTQGIWGLNDIVVDLSSLDGDSGGFDAPAVCAWIDIVAPLALVVLQWPTESGSYEPVEPFSDLLRHSGTDDWLLVWTTLTAVIPPLFDLAVKLKPQAAGTNEPAPQNTEDPMAEFYSPIVQGMAALPNTVLGSLYCSRTGAGASAIAATVLGNLSYNFALLLTAWVEAASGDTSVAAKTVIDGVGNIGAAIAIAEAATIPPK